MNNQVLHALTVLLIYSTWNLESILTLCTSLWGYFVSKQLCKHVQYLKPGVYLDLLVLLSQTPELLVGAELGKARVLTHGFSHSSSGSLLGEIHLT